MLNQTADLGDSILSIATDNGFFWETVWNHPQNAQLKALRKDPTLLAPGDSVFVPDLRKQVETRPTDARHIFKRKGVPAKLRIQLRVLGEPRANEPYVLNIDGTIFQGNTDGNGVVEQFIPPNAKGGELRLNGGKEVIPVKIGYLNPIDILSGVQQRLNNLGIYCGSEEGDMNDDTAAALRRFQQKYGLPVTGNADAATKAKLQQLHP
ncbi:MAG TPA: peptidoglycan-binding domain-containing protein [Bryobacteraceae bacterium]|nr:peptidoglycan-binding domain-containing protein [Bryobacteraceae bacterium]